MLKIPSRIGAVALVLTAGFGFGKLLSGPNQSISFLSSAVAQNVPSTNESPAATDSTLAAELTRADAPTRHRAPRDTFYLLGYVSVKTDKGVEGFEPGEEVHLVEVHRPTHTLVVSNGRAQVEVSPSQLTNDVDMGMLVRQKDQANQARVAAYMQTEQEAYNKFEREAAIATAKDVADRKEEQKEQVVEARAAAEQAKADRQPMQQANAPVGSNGYYDNGGFGYGSPYAYFVNQPSAAATNKAPTAAPAAAAPSNVAAPAAQAPAAGRAK